MPASPASLVPVAWAGGAQALVCVALALANAPTVAYLLLGLLGAGQTVTAATWQALLPSLVAPDRLNRALGQSQGGTSAAMIGAPALAGLCGTGVPLLLDAATCVVGAAAGLALRGGGGRGGSAAKIADAPSVETGPVAGGPALVWRNPTLRAVSTLVGTMILLASMVNVADVFLVGDVLHASTFWYGIAGAVYAVGLFAVPSPAAAWPRTPGPW